jgi:hypothetical protein
MGTTGIIFRGTGKKNHLNYYTMAKNIHKGTELNNVRETWDQNERERAQDNASGGEESTGTAAPARNDLEQIIREEAAEYDNANKEERVLGGDRATLNDEESDTAGDE